MTAVRVAEIADATTHRVTHAAHRLGYERWSAPAALAVCVAVALTEDSRGYDAVRAPCRACGDAWSAKSRPEFLVVGAEGFVVLCDPADFDLVAACGAPFVAYRVVVLAPYIDAIAAS